MVDPVAVPMLDPEVVPMVDPAAVPMLDPVRFRWWPLWWSQWWFSKAVFVHEDMSSSSPNGA
jgi:hypothetical protein